MSIRDDPAEFRAHMLADKNGEIALLGEQLDSWQRDDFAALDPAWQQLAGVPPFGPIYRRAWLERPRGHSKTTDMAAMVLWAIATATKLRRLSGIAAAADGDQAKLLLAACQKIIALNPSLSRCTQVSEKEKRAAAKERREIEPDQVPWLEVQAERIVNNLSGSTLTFISSDAASSYGLTPDFIVIDELTHWKTRALWDSLFSAAAKRSNCLLVVITNAGVNPSWQWDLREQVRQNENWYFSRLDGPVASWMTPETLAEQREILPSISYNRLWLNEWTSGSGDAIEPDDLTAAQRNPPAYEHVLPGGWVYVAGLDLGISHDASALVILRKHVGYQERAEQDVRELTPQQEMLRELGMFNPPDQSPDYIHHPGTGRLQVVHCQAWRPPAGGKVDLKSVETAIYDAHARWPLACVAYDPHQAEYLAQRVASRGIPCESLAFTGPALVEMAQQTLEAFRNRTIDLPQDKTLIADLASMRIEEKSYGFRLVSPTKQDGSGTRHGDTATALAIALATIKRFSRPAGPPRVNRPLLCWP